MRVILNSIGVIRKQAMVKHYKGYKIFDTMHDKHKFYLVFDPNNEVVGKFSNNKMATEWMKEQITLDKQAQNA